LHWIVSLFFGLVVAVALSLVKSVVGLRGLAIAASIVAGVGLICGTVYFAARVIDYGIRNRCDPSKCPPSLFARLSHLALVMLVPILPVVVAEQWGPPRGWLATVIGATYMLRDQDVPQGGSTATDDTEDKPATGSPDDAKSSGTRASAEPGAKERRGGVSDADPLRDPDNPFKLIEE